MARYRKYKKAKNPIEYEISLFIGIITFLLTANIIKGVAAFIICLVAAFLIAYKKQLEIRKKYLESGIDLVDKFTGEEFEVFLLAHFQNLGYKGDTTSKTKDYGADLILTKDNEKIVVQAKRWSSKVGIDAIQQIIGAKAYYKADKCMVITNNYYTSSAENLANSSDVELWDRKKLLDVMSKANGRAIAENSLDINVIEKRHLCKKCGSEMVFKKGKYGNFYGCSQYPKCKYTEDIKV